MSEKLTQEELEIISYIENEHPKSVANVEEEINRFSAMAKAHSEKKKAISLRITESDLYLLKKKALETGISYQNIIQSLIHQYTHDKIKASL